MIEQDISRVVIDGNEVVVIQSGDQSASGNVPASYTAGETISAADVVYQATDGKVYKADSATVAHAEKIIGVAKQSVVSGATLDVIIHGRIVDDAYNAFSDEKTLFLNGTGTLSATAPTTGFIMAIGVKTFGNVFYVNLTTPIILI